MTEVTATMPSAASNQPSRSQFCRASAMGSDIAPVLAADLEERLADLTERAAADRVHEGLEDVAPVGGGLLQRGERCRGLRAVLLVEGVQPVELRLLLGLGRPGQLDRTVLLLR